MCLCIYATDGSEDRPSIPPPLISPSGHGGLPGLDVRGASVAAAATGKAQQEQQQQQQRRRSDVDRELALKQHMVNGLQKGQEVTISPESLPGAQLFPVYKHRYQPDGTVGRYVRLGEIDKKEAYV